MTGQQAPAVPGLARWGLKPGVVEAVQLWPGNGPQIWQWADSKPTYGTDGFVDGLAVYTKAGRVRANFGDWIIKHGPGNFGKLTAEEFARTFDPVPEPLVMPPDEFAATRTVAEALGMVAPALAPAEPGAAIVGTLEPSPVAGRVEQDTATARTLITPALLAELGRRLYEYENAIGWNTSCTSCAAVMDSSIREHERAERAESKLSVLQASARAWAALAPDDDWGESMSDTIRADCGRAILAIIGTEGMAAAEGCPVAFIPGDPEFCTKCTCDQPARHGGSHHCPHCGVWYTLASDVKRAAATEGDGDHA